MKCQDVSYFGLALAIFWLECVVNLEIWLFGLDKAKNELDYGQCDGQGNFYLG